MVTYIMIIIQLCNTHGITAEKKNISYKTKI